MYAKFSSPSRCAWSLPACMLIALGACGVNPGIAAAQQQQPESVVLNISKSNERIEMTVNTSQILTLGTRIPRLVVNNPEVVTATPISENEVQIAARKPGVTQINLWDEKGQIYTVDILIFGDVRELELALKTMFPGSAVKVMRLTNSLVLEGQVDRPEVVSAVFRLAEDYAPKVVSNLTVGGAQQVMLKVKVMEVSRTKLRKLGVDFGVFGPNGFFVSSAADIISSSSSTTAQALGGAETVTFGVIDDGSTFLGFLDALQQKNVSKILADPTLVTVSGRPASFLVGGELPILVPSGLGQTTIEYKKFGTQIDFVPIVLGNGRIRLEVRPEVSEIDDSRSVTVNSFVVPALKVRRVDTGVEMGAGQTLALAGLIQERIESSHRGLPVVSDIPVLGIPFRKVQEQVNEIENLILVTPEFAEAMDPCEAPQCGPGMETMSPTGDQLYIKGMIEQPACGPCGASDPCACTAPGLGCNNPNGCNSCGGSGCSTCGGQPTGSAVMATDGGTSGTTSLELYGGQGYDMPAQPMPTPAESVTPLESASPVTPVPGPAAEPAPATEPGPAPLTPPQPASAAAQPQGISLPDPAAQLPQAPWQRTAQAPSHPSNRYNPSPAPAPAAPATSTPGLIGSIGYDVQK